MIDRSESSPSGIRGCRFDRADAGVVLSVVVTLCLTLTLTLAFTPTMACAEPFAVGTLIEAFQLYDQHDVLHDVDDETRVILFSRDMKGGKYLKTALEEVSQTYLGDRGAAYVSDISGMPSLIAKLFALPSMRRRAYPMLLDRDGTVTTAIPDVDGQATLVFLDQLLVDRIAHVSTASAVTQLLSDLPTSANDPTAPRDGAEPNVTSAPNTTRPDAPAE